MIARRLPRSLASAGLFVCALMPVACGGGEEAPAAAAAQGAPRATAFTGSADGARYILREVDEDEVQRYLASLKSFKAASTSGEPKTMEAALLENDLDLVVFQEIHAALTRGYEVAAGQLGAGKAAQSAEQNLLGTQMTAEQRRRMSQSSQAADAHDERLRESVPDELLELVRKHREELEEVWGAE